MELISPRCRLRPGDRSDDNAVGALLGSGAAVQIKSQEKALARVLLGLSCGGRGLALVVEGAPASIQP